LTFFDPKKLNKKEAQGLWASVAAGAVTQPCGDLDGTLPSGYRRAAALERGPNQQDALKALQRATTPPLS